MSISLTPVWEELKETIVAKWPEVVDGYEAMQASRLNWRDALASGQLEAPFVVIRPLAMEPYEELSIDDHFYKMPVEIYYVRSQTMTSAERTEYGSVMRVCEEKCTSLAHDIDHGSYSSFQVMDECIVDCSDGNEANISLTEGTGAPYVAGLVKAFLILSEMVEH